MIALRHKQFWLSWLVGLALVITGVVNPAQAVACAELSGTYGARPAEECPGMAQKAPCCCHPGEKVTPQHHAAHGAALIASGCGCTMEAPDAPATPAAKTSVLVVVPDLALVVNPLLQVELPRLAAWTFAAPSTGPPLRLLGTSGPSRAPPAL